MPPTPNWKLETNGSFRSRNTLAGSSLVAWQGILAVHDCKLSMTLHPFQFRHGCCIRAEGFLTAAERPATAEEPEEERQHRHAQALGRKQGSAKERKEYECPYCHAKTHSSIRTGKVQVAGHCGKQFRVRHGDVVRAFTHACPSCGTKVQSAKASGRIQSKHQKPNGKACPTTERVRK